MRKLSFLLIVALLLSIVPTMAQDAMALPDFIAAERTPCEVDLTGEVFNFAHIGDLSGPYGPITQPVLAAYADAVAYFNEHGGICGATIALPDPTTVDTGGNPELTQSIYDRVSAESPRMLVLYSSGDSELLRDQVAEDEIPVIISAGSVAGLYGPEGNEPGWIFATNPLYVDQFGHYCEYAAENIESPVIGYLSWQGAFGTAAYTPEAIAYCESLGVEVLDEPQLFLPTDTDISGAVQALVDGGANILYTNSLATGPALIAATVTNLGLNDQVRIAGVNWAVDSSVGLLGLQSIAPNGAPSVNGIVGSLPFAWWSELANPGVAFMTEVATANERALTLRNIAYILGFSSVDVYIEVMVQTANRAGGMDFGGAEVYETLQGLDYNSLQVSYLKFTNDEGEAIRDTEWNRMAVLTYAGAEGGTILDGQAPLLVALPDGREIPVPVNVPLEEFRSTPDLRPGGSDVPPME